MSLPVSERRSVLVVDDDPDVRSIVRENIHRISRDAVVQEATNGLEALLRAERQKFHLIITDLKMPKKDGVKLLEALARLEKTFQPDRVIVLSGCFAEPGYDIPPDVIRIQKPCTEDELRASILGALPEESAQRSPAQLFNDELSGITLSVIAALQSFNGISVTHGKPTVADARTPPRGLAAGFDLGPGTLAEQARLEIEAPWLDGLKVALPCLTREELVLEACSRIQSEIKSKLLQVGIQIGSSEVKVGPLETPGKPLIQIPFKSRLGDAWLLLSLRTTRKTGSNAD